MMTHPCIPLDRRDRDNEDDSEKDEYSEESESTHKKEVAASVPIIAFPVYGAFPGVMTLQIITHYTLSINYQWCSYTHKKLNL